MTEQVITKVKTREVRPMAAKLNPRKSPTAIAELRESIRQKGILQPLVLRRKKLGKTTLEVVIGNRRLQAALELGLAEIPAEIREDVSDMEARKLNLTEQLQREDLQPLDEAAMLAELIKSKKGDRRAAVIELAAELGKGVRYIARRENMLELHPKILSGKAAGFSAERWTVEALEALAVLPHAKQLELVNDPFGEIATPAEIESEVRELTQRLEFAPWDLEDDKLVPKAGSCVGCTKNSCNAPGLFEEVVSDDPLENAVCRDRECWLEKSAAHVRGIITEKEAEVGESLELIRNKGDFRGGVEHAPAPLIPETQHGAAGQSERKKLPSVTPEWEWAHAKKSEKGARRGLVVSGKRTGEVIWIKPASSRSPSAGASKNGSKKKTPAKKTETPAAEKKRLELALEERRRAWRIEHVREAVEKAGKTPPAALTKASDWAQRVVAVYGWDTGMGSWVAPRDGKKRVALWLSDAWPKFAEDVWRGVRPRILKALAKSPPDRDAQDVEAAFVWLHVLGNVEDLRDLSEDAIAPQKRLEVLREGKVATKKKAPARKKAQTRSTKKAARKKAKRIPARSRTTRKTTKKKAKRK